MLNSILKSSSLYAIGTIARASSSIIMLPIYTRYLSPSVYGTAELLNLILDLTVLLLGARITAGLFKLYSDEKAKIDKHKVLTTCIWLGLCANALALFLLWFAAPIISELLKLPDITDALRMLMFTIAFGTISEIGMGYFRINDQAGKYLIISLFKLAIQIAASVYFIIYLELGLMGIIYSALISAGLQALVLLTILLPIVGMSFSKRHAKMIMDFSLPIIFASVAMYYMTFGDRYFLQYFHGPTYVGIYALGYKFGFMLLALVWAPFMSYWSAKQFDYAQLENGKQTFEKIFPVANYILWIAATAMLFMSKPIIVFMADESYHSASQIVPLIILAYIFQGWTEFHRFGILNSKNTSHINHYNWITAAIISLLYIALIPEYGATGAALSTVLAMFVRFLLIYYKAQQYYPFYTNWKKIGSLLALSIICYLGELYVNQNSPENIATALSFFAFTILLSFLLKLSPIILKDIIKYRTSQ